MLLLSALPLLHAQEWAPSPALDQIHVLQDYRAGKTSYVEATSRHAGAWTGKGYRHTLLDVQGAGSLRHVWSTHDEGGPYVRWEFYVDGETKPSLRGRLEDLVDAAAKLKACPAPACSVPRDPAKRDYNLYTPVPFQRGLRVDVVQETDEVGLLFAQLDYRTEDPSLGAARLQQVGEGKATALKYAGWQPASRAAPVTEPVTFAPRQVRPGERVLIGSVEGTGVLRRLRVQAPLTDATVLHVRYDGADTDALSVPLASLFAAFDGASFARIGPNEGALYLPMPFAKRVDLYVENRSTAPIRAGGSADVERAAAFDPRWGYLHGHYAQSPGTNGYQPNPLVYVRGRGHFVGLSLFESGHDHGGGDFVVLDGESATPAFLHGINGEDYFTFAWFSRGQHQPYAQAVTNDLGRYRHHLENPAPFQKSLQVEFGAFPGLNPRSFVVWYQDAPSDTTLAPDDPVLVEPWDVFGTVPIATREGGGLFDALPKVKALDAGGVFKASNQGERFEAGWLADRALGASLNLTYVTRHGVKVSGERNLGGNGHLFLARKRFVSAAQRALTLWLSHDDPVEIELNGAIVYSQLTPSNGFRTQAVPLTVRAGANELVIRGANYFNSTFNWAGVGMWFVDADGTSVRLSALGR